MEHGLQTHTIPKGEAAHGQLAKRAGFSSVTELDTVLERNTANVQKVFEFVFSEVGAPIETMRDAQATGTEFETIRTERKIEYDRFESVSPHFAQMYSASSGRG